MPRLQDDEYFEERTRHFAQGDIFREVPFYYGEVNPVVNADEPTIAMGYTGYGVLITYTSGILRQPPKETREYAHPWRIVAPLVPIELLVQRGVFTDRQVEQLRRDDNFGRIMYVPSFPGEWRESGIICYQAALVYHDVLEGKRITQLKLPAAVRLQEKLATTFLGGKWNPDDLSPDLSDHWT